MSPDPLALKPISSAPSACKICGGVAKLYGVVDFHKSCEELRGFRLPLSGVPIYYRRCAACGFLFTDAFDDWSQEQFKTHVYNDGYRAVDPDYQSVRPTANAGFVANRWAQHRANTRVLDFGGGNDVFCAALRANGFALAVTYDPMVPEYASRPEGKFDLVTCFETLEHLPDPVAGIAQIIECVEEPGAVFYSTLTQPAEFDKYGVSWWYVGPRNGHISIFTKQALALAWRRFGYNTVSYSDVTHMAYRTLPGNWQFS
jgi:SAM-dependent methyltransferase